MIDISGHLRDQKQECGFEDEQNYITVNCCGFQKFITKNFIRHREKGRLDYQAIYIIKGTGSYKIDGQFLNVEEGNVIIYKPEEEQHYKYDFDNCTEVYWVHFTGYSAAACLENANLTENAARLVFKSNLKINNRFVYYFTLSDNFKDQVGLATKIVAQPKLALTRLAEVELPIPSIEIQNKEVKIFDELSRKFQEINTEQLSKLAYLKALKSSILDRAFKGEL